MRISNPKLFNGQTLATKQQISAWLAGNADNSFGTLSIPASNVKYGNSSNVSAQIANIYTKLGLDNSGEGGDATLVSRVANIENVIKVAADGNYIVSGSNVNTNLSNLDTNLKTVSGNLDIAEAAISTLTGAVETSGSVKYEAKAAADSALADAKAYTDALASGRVATAEGEIDAIQAQLAGLSQTTVVEYVENVSGNLQDAIDAAVSGADIEITSVAGGDYAMVYTIKQGGTDVGTINIPKDQFLQSGEYIPSAEVLRLTFALPQGESNTVDIPVGALVDEYSGSSAITITDNVDGKNIISLKVAAGENYLAVTDKGLESNGIDDAIDAAVSGANAKLAGITDTVSAYVTDAISSKANTGDVTDINDRLTTAENTITTLTGGVEVSGSVKYEAADAAAKAVSGVNAKLDGITGTVSGAIDAAVSGKAAQADLATVSGDLNDLEDKVGELVTGNYISGAIVASDLNALDTQVKANADAIAANAEAIANHKTAIETAMQIVSVSLTAAADKVSFDGVDCYSYAAPTGTTYILQVTSGGMAVCADINGTTVYVDSTGLDAAPALSALIAKPVVIATTPAV